MGNSFGVEQEKNNKKHKFGGYKNVSNPRPGYYKTPSEVYYRGNAMGEAIPSTFKKLKHSWRKLSNLVESLLGVLYDLLNNTLEKISKRRK